MLQDIFWAALEWTAEYKNWGWNAATVSTCIIIAVTGPETWGIIKQGETIWKDKKGDSVSNVMFAFTFSFFFVAAIYGWHLKSVSLIANSVITGFAQVPILWGLLKFKGFSKREFVLAGVFALMPIAELATSLRGELYLVFSFGLWYAFGAQLWELWREKARGEVDVRLLVVYLIATSAWTTFAFSGDEPYFKASQVGISSFIFAINVLWWWFWLRDKGVLPDWLMPPTKSKKDPA